MKFKGLTRRDALKLSGLTLGGLAVGGRPAVGKAQVDCSLTGTCYPTDESPQRYTYFDELDEFTPGTPLDPDEMRITFMGSMVPPPRRVTQEMSVFVEVGWVTDPDGKNGRAKDQFIFDCGSGVSANYGAMGVGYARMDKVFLNHLHGDHMSDLSHIYCFGPSGDRKSPLYVWGPGPSGVRSPRRPYSVYDDGTRAFCENLRKAMRWHSESFSFQTTSYGSYERPTRESWGLPVAPIPVGDDPPDDAYALVPIELPWRNYGERREDNVAYKNPATGVKITHFPVIHCRKGSIGYKLEWNGLSMIYTSDTKPETHSIRQACNHGRGVDVFVHEMGVPPDVWAMKMMGLSEAGSGSAWDQYVAGAKAAQDSSHTPQGAFGYLLSQLKPRPRLTVATHFPVADDTVACALKSVREHCPGIRWNKKNGEITWSFDLMVIRVFAGDPARLGHHKPRILQQRAVVNDFSISTYPPRVYPDPNWPKYHTPDGDPDPFAQIDRSTEILAGDDTFCESGY